MPPTRRYTTSPPHQTPPALCYIAVFATVVFYISPPGLAKSLPLGGKVGRPFGPGRMRAGVEVPHGVGNRRTGVRWQRNSSTPRYYKIAPSSVTFGDSEAYATTVRWGDCYDIFLHKPHRACQSLPLGV